MVSSQQRQEITKCIKGEKWRNVNPTTWIPHEDMLSYSYSSKTTDQKKTTTHQRPVQMMAHMDARNKNKASIVKHIINNRSKQKMYTGQTITIRSFNNNDTKNLPPVLKGSITDVTLLVATTTSREKMTWKAHLLWESQRLNQGFNFAYIEKYRCVTKKTVERTYKLSTELNVSQNRENVLTIPLFSELRGNEGNFSFCEPVKNTGKSSVTYWDALQLSQKKQKRILHSPSATSAGCKLFNKFIMRSWYDSSNCNTRVIRSEIPVIQCNLI